MFHNFELVRILAGKYKGRTGTILKFHIDYTPTLYEVQIGVGTIVALFENEIERLYNLSEKMGVE